MRLKGFFGARLIDARTNRIRYETSQLEPNLIVNQGLYRMGQSTFFTHCHVGTGSVAPDPADTSLTSFLAATANTAEVLYGYQGSVAPYYGWRRMTFTFAAGTVVGNISEVATAWSSTPSTIFSKSLLKDGGVPITLSVVSSDILQIVYEIRSYLPETDLAFTTTIAGVLTNCVARPAYVTSSWGLASISTFFGSSAAGYSTAYESDVLGTITSGPPGSSSNCNHNIQAYVPSTTVRGYTLDFALNQGNFTTGIGSLLVRNTLGHWQISLSPKIAKTATKTLSIALQSSWGAL